MGGILDQVNTKLKEKVSGEKIPDGATVPRWKDIVIEMGLTEVGLKELADRRKKKRQGGQPTGTGEAMPNQSESKEQQKIIDQLKKARKAANTTTAMAKYTDPAEAIVSLFPGLGDAGASITLAAYYHYLGRMVGFSRKQHKKINTILAIDGTVGLVPVVGDILDVAYQGCKKIGKLFVSHYESLAKKAKQQGVPQSVLADIHNNTDVDEDALDKRKHGKGEETIPVNERDSDGDGIVDNKDPDFAPDSDAGSTTDITLVDEVPGAAAAPSPKLSS